MRGMITLLYVMYNFLKQAKGQCKIAFREAAHYGKADKIARDLKTPFAVVGSRFWYFGENAPTLPNELTQTTIALPDRSRRGHRVNDDPHIIKVFVSWLSQHKPGIHGYPRDLLSKVACTRS